MTDISKCDGEGCEQKDTCWRFLAPSNPYRQSYMNPPNRGKECIHYWWEPYRLPKPKKKKAGADSLAPATNRTESHTPAPVKE